MDCKTEKRRIIVLSIIKNTIICGFFTFLSVNNAFAASSVQIGTTVPILVTAPVISEIPEFTAGLENTISWGEVNYAIAYEAQISTDPNFTSIVETTEWVDTLSVQFSNLKDGVTYYYRVRGRASVEQEGLWSETAYSTQDNSPPTSTITSPIEKTTDEIVTLNLSVSDEISGVFKVTVMYRRNSGEWKTYTTISPQDTVDFNTTVYGGDGYYEFYTIAEDFVGNVESKPQHPEAHVYVYTKEPVIPVEPTTRKVTISGAAFLFAKIYINYNGQNILIGETDDYGNFSADVTLPTIDINQFSVYAKREDFISRITTLLRAGENQLKVALPPLLFPPTQTKKTGEEYMIFGYGAKNATISIYTNGSLFAQVKANEIGYFEYKDFAENPTGISFEAKQIIDSLGSEFSPRIFVQIRETIIAKQDYSILVTIFLAIIFFILILVHKAIKLLYLSRSFVEGIIYEIETNKPAAGIQVLLVNSKSGEIIAKTSTNKEGYYSFRIKAGKHILSIRSTVFRQLLLTHNGVSRSGLRVNSYLGEIFEKKTGQTIVFNIPVKRK